MELLQQLRRTTQFMPQQLHRQWRRRRHIHQRRAHLLRRLGSSGRVLLEPPLSSRRQLGTGGYRGQSFLSWSTAEMDGFGRFPVQDGNVGIVSNTPLEGQIPLYRWSTSKGFYYSTYYTSHGSDYVYGGIAAYVYPPGDTRGFPLYQFYNTKYGHFYTGYKSEVGCQPQDGSGWADQGEIARVNFPAPLAQANKVCPVIRFNIPQPCDPFAAFRCMRRGAVWLGNCTCSDGLP